MTVITSNSNVNFYLPHISLKKRQHWLAVAVLMLFFMAKGQTQQLSFTKTQVEQGYSFHYQWLDYTKTEQTINFVLKARNFPGDSLSTDNTSSFTSSTTKIDTRARGRQAVIRFESDDDGDVGVRSGVGFRVGATRLDLQPNGRR